VAGLPLVIGSALISFAVLNLVFSEGFFMLEWMGVFLALYGLSYLGGPRMAMALSGVVLVAGSLGDIVLEKFSHMGLEWKEEEIEKKRG